MAAGVRWSMQRRLYAKLKDSPDLLTGNTLMQAFVSQQENAPIGQFYSVQKNMEALYLIDSTTQANLDANDMVIQQVTAELADVDSLLSLDPEDETLLEKWDSLGNVIETKSVENATIYAQLQSTLAQDAAAIIAANAAISTTAVYESNEKTVNDIFLNAFVKGNLPLSSLQSDDVEDIAHQCVEEGGPAVYRARAVYAWLTGIPVQDVQCIEGRSSGFEQGMSEVVPDKPLIYPNPSSGSFAVVLPASWQYTSGVIVLKDVTGRVMYKLGYREGAMAIPVEHPVLRGGVYVVEVRNSDGQSHTDKIILLNH